MEVNEIILDLYNEGIEETSDLGLQNCMEFIFYLIAKEEYNKIDFLLNVVDLKRLAPEYLVGLPRITYLYKEYLAEWVVFREKVELELNVRKLDTIQLLQGI